MREWLSICVHAVERSSFEIRITCEEFQHVTLGELKERERMCSSLSVCFSSETHTHTHARARARDLYIGLTFLEL